MTPANRRRVSVEEPSRDDVSITLRGGVVGVLSMVAATLGLIAVAAVVAFFATSL